MSKQTDFYFVDTPVVCIEATRLENYHPVPYHEIASHQPQS